MITEKFLLESDAAIELYEKYAAPQPIIDYHNHLDPQKIAEDYTFRSITELWLGGDHYKWRALRANGVGEEWITGAADDKEKFMKWAETVPYTMRNPLYHWTHLELLRYFDLPELLNRESGERIYHHCNALLQEKEFSVRGLLRKMRVELLCTTDDPVDDLRWHQQLAQEGFEIRVLPTWRPDKVMAVDDPIAYRQYLHRLEAIADQSIHSFGDLLEALSRRQAHFAALGCRISDHGLDVLPAAGFTESALEKIFHKLLISEQLTADESATFKSGMFYHLAVMNHQMGWAQQFHIGAIRNNNRRLFKQLGPDIGCDSIGDSNIIVALARFLSRLDEENKLTRTILYNLNPKDSEALMSMACNFNDGSIPGKMQYGAAWWFLDQPEGIRQQIEVLSHGGLLSRFVGMVTDSRSFLSFPRHEYFRRLLCNILGNDLEKGLLPMEEIAFIGKMTENICYHNAKSYFGV